MKCNLHVHSGLTKKGFPLSTIYLNKTFLNGGIGLGRGNGKTNESNEIHVVRIR